MGYRKISFWLKEHGYRTTREHEFKNTHVFSILKKKSIADEWMEKRFEPTNVDLNIKIFSVHNKNTYIK